MYSTKVYVHPDTKEPLFFERIMLATRGNTKNAYVNVWAPPKADGKQQTLLEKHLKVMDVCFLHLCHSMDLAMEGLGQPMHLWWKHNKVRSSQSNLKNLNVRAANDTTTFMIIQHLWITQKSLWSISLFEQTLRNTAGAAVTWLSSLKMSWTAWSKVVTNCCLVHSYELL